MSSEGSTAAITMPNQAVPLRSFQEKGRGNRPSSAGAREHSVVTSVQPFSAPMPDTTATAAISFPAHVPCGNIVPNASTNGAPLPTSAWCGTRPITAAATSRYKTALTPVPSTEARPTFLRGFLTRLAVIAATSTPMKENSATPAAIPMQLYRLPPEALNGPKLALRTKNQPTTPTNSSGRNFSTTVTFWNQAICRTPARFTAAGTHRPTSAMPQFVMPEGWLMPNKAST